MSPELNRHEEAAVPERQHSIIEYQLEELAVAMATLREATARVQAIGEGLRAQGTPYSQLGEAAGISTQAAYQRWSENGRKSHRDRQRARGSHLST